MNLRSSEQQINANVNPLYYDLIKRSTAIQKVHNEYLASYVDLCNDTSSITIESGMIFGIIAGQKSALERIIVLNQIATDKYECVKFTTSSSGSKSVQMTTLHKSEIFSYYRLLIDFDQDAAARMMWFFE